MQPGVTLAGLASTTAVSLRTWPIRRIFFPRFIEPPGHCSWLQVSSGWAGGSQWPLWAWQGAAHSALTPRRGRWARALEREGPREHGQKVVRDYTRSAPGSGDPHA